MNIDISIAKAQQMVVVDASRLPHEVQRRALTLGLSILLNAAHSSLKKGTVPADEVMAAVRHRLDALYAGNLPLPGGLKQARPPEENEALRLATLVLRMGGTKSPKAAEAASYLEQHPELLEAARRNVEEARKLAGVASPAAEPEAPRPRRRKVA